MKLRLNIHRKFALVTAIAMFIITFLSVGYLLHLYEEFVQLRKQDHYIQKIDQVADVLHNLQLERGLGVFYLYGELASSKSLSALYPITDKSIHRLLENIDAFHPSYKLMIQLETLRIVRQNLLAQEIDPLALYQYYTTVNDLLLSFSRAIDPQSSLYSRENIFLVHELIDLQEYASRERTYSAVLLANTKNWDEHYHNYYYLSIIQDKLLEDMHYYVTKDLVKTFFDELKQVEIETNFAYFREHIHRLDTTRKVKSFNLNEFFYASTQRIDLLHDYEQAFLSGIMDTNLQQRAYILSKLAIFTVLLLLVLGALFTLTFVASQSIKNSIFLLHKGMDSFFDFLNNKTEKIEHVKIYSNDEIEQIARQINKQINIIEKNIENDQDFILESTQVVKMMQEGDFSEKVYFEPNSATLQELKEVLNKLIDLIHDKIAEQTRSLETLNSSLEDKVYEQTIELHQKLEEITAANEKIIQAQKAKDEFLANMSHEIRTPLNAILGFVAILKKKITDEKHVKYLDVIDTSGQTLMTIIGDVLDFSKIQSGKLNIHKEATDVVRELSTAITLFASKANEKNIFYFAYVDPTMPHLLEIDVVRVKQILSNLLSNAIKFTPTNGEIKVRVIYADTQLAISVQDSGIGISKENQAKIFEAFEQADGSTTRKFGGTGLGLSISLTLAKMMDGALTLQSEEGKGATFTCKLPANVVDASIRQEAISEYVKEKKIALLHFLNTNATQTKLVKKYLEDFGAKDIHVLQHYEDGYDLYFFVPDEEYNDEIIDGEKPAVALLRTNELELSTFSHIRAVYAPYLPLDISHAVEEVCRNGC